MKQENIQNLWESLIRESQIMNALSPRIDKNINPLIPFNKSGSKIHIKKENKGKFTSYCGGTVTSACIARGKNSSDPAVRKRATFAANARKWKH